MPLPLRRPACSDQSGRVANLSLLLSLPTALFGQPGDRDAVAVNVAVGAEPSEQAAEPEKAPVSVPVWRLPDEPDVETTGTLMLFMLPGQPNEPVISPVRVIVAGPLLPGHVPSGHAPSIWR